MKKYIALLIISLFLLLGCAELAPFIKQSGDIPNFHQVDEKFYRGSVPNEQGWEKLQTIGIKTVISLKNNKENSLQEQKTAKALGIKFYHLPMTLYQRPDDRTVLKFLELVLTKNNQPIFVYCPGGKDRTGVMIAMYRVVACGMTIQQGYQEAKKYGFWPYYGETPELKNFIHQLKDKTIYFEKARELINAQNN
ncbi:MAG: dual specificity protein phosphatase family protein [PVC group bacterium]|nr:dual specificity protein phosphatase family protein [PVC group bacterium]